MLAHAGGSAPFAQGEIVAGKYRVETLLGEGGMGFVIAAEHVQLGRRVALKVLHPRALDSDEAVARFLHEARAAALLQSEHIARVTDVGTLDSGAPYMVMELLEGTDLAKVVEADAPLPIAEAADFVIQACEGLAEAHLNGIVHRDLKPANLFVTSRLDGAPLVKVLDFGISKSKINAPVSELTSTSSLIGSPKYMSPEQMQDSRAVDPRSDIWALGAILFEMLTGRPAFDAPTVATLCVKILNDPAPSLAETRDGTPKELDALVAKCLQKDPNARFQTVAELAEALAAFAPDESLATVQRIVRMVRGARSTPLRSRRRLASSPDLPSPTPGSSARRLPRKAPVDRTPELEQIASENVNEMPTVGELVAVQRQPSRAPIMIAAVLLLTAVVLVMVALRAGTPSAQATAASPTATATASVTASATAIASTSTTPAPDPPPAASPPAPASAPPSASAPPPAKPPPVVRPIPKPNPGADDRVLEDRR